MRSRLAAALAVLALLAGCASAQTDNATPAPSPTLAPAPTATPMASETQAASVIPPPASASAPTPASDGEPIGPTVTGRVVDVVDGDTIKVDIGGQTFTVRYIGMDTPETVKPGTPVQWMGPEASAANKDLVAGREVVLEKDVSETDRYGRLLRYVWLHDASGWLLVNAELVRRGFASVATFPPDVARVDQFLAAQRQAREAGRGLWSATPPPSTAGSPGSGDCDPAYPDVCIPPPPPDLDCADIPYRRFAVLAPDPHHFDGDGNGIGCEAE